jgi:hypothetical protein
MDEPKVSIPNVFLSDLERLAQKVRDVAESENPEISFEFIIASLFPTSWKNIQNDLNHYYTKGYIQGCTDKEREIRDARIFNFEDSDCYCE